MKLGAVSSKEDLQSSLAWTSPPGTVLAAMHSYLTFKHLQLQHLLGSVVGGGGAREYRLHKQTAVSLQGCWLQA